MNSFQDIEKFKSVSEIVDLAENNKVINLTNVKGGLQDFIALSVYKQGVEKNISSLFLLPTEQEAREKFNLLKKYSENVYFLPAEPLHYYFSDAYSITALRERLNTLNEAVKGKPILAITSIEALLKKLPKPESFKASEKKIEVGEEFGYDNLINLLLDYGYERTYQTEAPGQFSVRGEIVDVFLMNQKKPVRIDFFDDEVDSIKFFDPYTQRSINEVESLSLNPSNENWLPEAEKQKVLKKLKKLYEDSELFEVRYNQALEESKISDGILFSFTKSNSSFLDYLKTEAGMPIVFWAGVDESKEQVQEYLGRVEADYEALALTGEAFKEEKERYFTFKQIETRIRKCPLIRAYLFSSSSTRNKTIDMDSRVIESFIGQPNILKEFLKNRINRNYLIHFFAKDEDGLERIKNFLTELEIPFSSDSDDQTTGVRLSVGEIAEGFELAQDKIVFLNESDFFKTERRKRRKKNENARPLQDFSELSEGDYVVHDEYGIGKYLGLVQLDVSGTKKDMMLIEYANNDKLYIPVEQTDVVQIYIGAGSDEKPKINALGSKQWAKDKSRARKAAEDIADELIALYSKREHSKGHAFGPDTQWQTNFEDAFPYEETEDQIQSIKEIKKDMQKETPMERLLCGDVGYGKTEVAFRAAFKAAMENKQTVILVPTTVLASQHFQSAQERFKDFPINIELLSRFKTPKETKEIKESLKEGSTDIVIGTHKLLSGDVKFKDLGLLIIDEEQRFGVKAKEKLKHLKENIDVLTLSATPIPRTLHMSLSGIRDMSVIEQPPPGRQPVQTYVLAYNEQIIKDAIRRELARNGQVYYIHNRVHDIDSVTNDLKRLVPEARIISAHGQMTPKQLENVMQRFLDHEYDILVSTTIVENGLDVQNANTLIVEDGDHFGLSQLYQLRGRVGRSSKQAYAYITHKRKLLNEDAVKRLQALRDFTSFGSGFKIALKDLEIRGAGNLLGSQQSGHMVKIGYELYTRILDSVLKEKLTGVKPKEFKETNIYINVDAYVPSGYIIGDGTKFEIYRKLARLKTFQEYLDLEDELIDRFGDVPPSVYNLMLIAMIKNMANSLGMTKVDYRSPSVYFSFDNPEEALEAMKVALTLDKYTKELKLNAGTNEKPVWQLTPSNKALSDYKLLKYIYNFLEEIEKQIEGENN